MSVSRRRERLGLEEEGITEGEPEQPKDPQPPTREDAIRAAGMFGADPQTEAYWRAQGLVMVPRLYHGADEERAASILARGFREADETGLASHDRTSVLLYRRPEGWTQDGSLFVDVLLEVGLAIPAEEFERYTDPADAGNSHGPIYWVPALRCAGAAIRRAG